MNKDDMYKNYNVMRIIVILICILSYPNIYAQESLMLAKGNKWIYTDIYAYHGSDNSETWYEIKDTQVENGQEYYVLHIFQMLLDGQSTVHMVKGYEGGYHATLLLREDNGRIYVQRQQYTEFMQNNWIYQTDNPFISSSEAEHLLYDFTLNEGDVYPMLEDVHVVSVGSLSTYDGVNRKLLTLSNGMEILEGVGCLNSLGGLLAYQSTGAGGDDDGETKGMLYSFFHNGNDCVYEMGLTRISNIYPQDTDDIIYDLSGRPVTTPRRGIYIQGGRKVVR